jgi:hypothetical protein
MPANTQEEQAIAGAEFLHVRDPNLQKSAGITAVVNYLNQNGEGIPNQPGERINAELEFRAEQAADGILTGDKESIDRQVEAALVKQEDVPEAYFDFQKRILREQGYGDADLSFEHRRQLVEVARNDQRARLLDWSEYISSDDAGYPNWFKQYAWESMLRLKPLDDETETFKRRSKGTTAPYPELNPEALAYVYDALVKTHVQGKEVEGDELAKLVKSGNFAKLYANALGEVPQISKELLANLNGSWVKFEKTDDPEAAARLSGSLNKHGTGWCTAGEATAAMQLHHGDFHVFYTTDEDGNDTVPRIAIRMHGGRVVEVRGILPGQVLEPDLIDTAIEQVKDLPGGDIYVQKAADMRRLTAIDDRLREDPRSPLSNDELTFIYEIERDVVGFGYRERDPRVGKILRTRNVVSDLRALGLSLEGRVAKQVKYHNLMDQILEGIDKVDQKSVELAERLKGKKLPPEIQNSIDINSPLDADKLLHDILTNDKAIYFRIDMYVEYFELDPKEAITLILTEGGREAENQVLFNFDSYPEVDTEYVLNLMVDTGKISGLLEYRKDFVTKLSPYKRHLLANYMKKAGDEDTLVSYLDSFPEVNRVDFAKDLMETDQADLIFYHMSKFPDVDKAELAKLVLADTKITPLQLAFRLGDLPELGASEVAHRLMESGEYSYLARNLESFPDIDPVTLLTHMVAHGHGDDAMQLVRHGEQKYQPDWDTFPAVEKRKFAQQLLKEGQSEFVKQHQSALGIKRDELFEMETALLPKRKRIAKRLARKALEI